MRCLAKGNRLIFMIDFVRQDQILMSAASNYLRFQFDLLLPYLKGDVLEIGAGIGNMTTQLLKQAARITSLTCIEADPDCYAELARGNFPSRLEKEIIQGYFPDTVPENRLFDLIYHFNVLEHIEDDERTLAACFQLLKPGGIHFIFVPAFQILYGSMDRLLEHHRRYRRKDLIRKLQQSGHRVLQSRYCNPIGFLGWFVNNRILKIREQQSKQIRFFDRYILPAQNRLERRLPMPFGQSLYIVATKGNMGGKY